MTLSATPAVGQLRSSARSRTGMIRRRALLGYLLVSPALLLSVLFFVLPMILLAAMSFTDWPLLGTPSWAGPEKYVRAFTDRRFLDALAFTALFTAALVPVSIAVSYLTAVMVRGHGRFVAFVRTSFFLPVVIGFTAAAYMAQVMLMPGTGIINIALEAIGASDGRTAWFTQPGTAFWAVLVLSVWKSIGVAMILLMAGMQAVPEELHDAAKIDGAGWWRREASVTFPLIRRQFALCMILSLSGTLLVFDQFYVLTKGGPSGSTTTAVMYTYQQSFVRFDLGYGAALSMVLTGLILVIALVQLRTLRADGSGGAS
ncbi:carbohydrate ABC transporter permease [Brachybacterium hainanense]|uniref:Carbohydrate ABC transporter permease n=1 Tax=Brachybacterium hainanense TaxID=1541174 RepID=A0ABV6R861_9MICO